MDMGEQAGGPDGSASGNGADQATIWVETLAAAEALPVIRVTLAPALEPDAVRAARERVAEERDRLGEAAYALLVDLRPVRRASEQSLALVRALESDAAQSGRLHRLAHLVATEEQVQRSRERLERAGVPDLFRDFTTEAAARLWLTEPRPEDPAAGPDLGPPGGAL